MFSESAADDLREMVITNRSILGTTQKLKVLASSSVDMIVKGQAPREIEENVEFSMTFNLDCLTDGLQKVGDRRVSIIVSSPMGIQGLRNWLIGGYIASFDPDGCLIFFSHESLQFTLKSMQKIGWPKWSQHQNCCSPSIIFGLLGLAVILNFWFTPQYALVGGIVLSLMTLPTIIIACRAKRFRHPSERGP